MNYDYYEKQFRHYDTLVKKGLFRKKAFLQVFLFLTSSLFGILISLQTSAPYNLYARLCFSFAVLLLSISILSVGASLYSQIRDEQRAIRLYHCELKSAIRSKRQVEPVFVSKGRFFEACEPIAYISFLLAFVLLAVYSFLINF